MRWLAFGFTVLAAICGGLVLIATKRGDTLKAARDAEGQAKARQTEKALAEVQNKTRDRHLTPDLMDDLSKLARKHGPQLLVIIERSGSNEEASKLANLIGSAVVIGGWKVERQRQSLISANPTYGLYCAYGGPQQKAVAQDLAELFRGKGLRFETWERPDRKLPLALDVGLKP
jgi:hypothetical protein